MAALELDLERTVLILNDLQRAIIDDSPLAPSDVDAARRFDAVVAQNARVLAAARAEQLGIIHVRVAFSPGYPEASPHLPMLTYMREHGVLLDGQPGTEFDPRVKPEHDELVITKHAISAFAGTPLDRLLRAQGYDTLLLSGLVTHYAVEGTARDAADRGFRVLVLTDCCASGMPARHEHALENLRALVELRDSQELLTLLAE